MGYHLAGQDERLGDRGAAARAVVRFTPHIRATIDAQALKVKGCPTSTERPCHGHSGGVEHTSTVFLLSGTAG